MTNDKFIQLEGTEEQITQANEIRAEIIGNYQRQLDEYENYRTAHKIDDRAERKAAIVKQIINLLSIYDSAEWWIEHRDDHISDIFNLIQE